MLANVLQWSGAALLVAGVALAFGYGAGLITAGLAALLFGVAEERK